MRRFVPRYEVVFSGGAFFAMDGNFLKSFKLCSSPFSPLVKLCFP